jgi:hypothetical protein
VVQRRAPGHRVERRLLLRLAVVLLFGCHHQASLPLGGAEETVRDFFAAAENGDIARLAPLLIDPAGETRARTIIADFGQHQAHLVRVVGSTVDGRDPNAALVKVELSFSGKSHQWIMKVQHGDAGWRLRY